jgi:hypothetical protein
VILPTPPFRYAVDDQSALRRTLEQTVNDLRRRIQTLEATASRVFNAVIDGGGAVIATGDQGEITVPKGRITGWQISADQTGSIVVDVQKSTGGGAYASIAGSEKPTLSAAITNSDTSLTTWTVGTLLGDKLKFVVDSATTVERVTVSLYFTPSA